MSYNGWSNHETWLVALWIDNEEATYDDRLDATRRALSPSDLASWLKSYTSNLLPSPEGLAGDLMQSALSEVDWYEIAESWLADEPSDEDESCDETT